MSNLQHTVKTGLDITSVAEVLSYTYTGISVLQVASRVILGDVSHPITGTSYNLYVYINNVLLSPNTTTIVPNGTTQTMVVSRPVPLVPGDVISIRVQGTGSDISVDTIADLYDATSLTVSDVQGSGATLVDHNYGGLNALAYKTSLGQGIAGATILIYLKSNYDNGLRSDPYVVARSQTIGDGTWARGVMLSPGTYSIVFYLRGLYGPDKVDVTIT